MTTIFHNNYLLKVFSLRGRGAKLLKFLSMWFVHAPFILTKVYIRIPRFKFRSSKIIARVDVFTESFHAQLYLSKTKPKISKNFIM